MLQEIGCGQLEGALLIYFVLIAAELYKSTVNLSIYICVDSSWAVLVHHRSFIPSTLVSQLEEKKNPGLPPYNWASFDILSYSQTKYSWGYTRAKFDHKLSIVRLLVRALHPVDSVCVFKDSERVRENTNVEVIIDLLPSCS